MNLDDTHIGRMAEWAAGVTLDDVPSSVVERARLQILSVFGAVHAGSLSDAGKKLLQSMKGRTGNGRCTVLPTGWRAEAEDALYMNAALSCAHDYDDYLFMGHTGHSAVLAPLAVCQELNLSCREMMCAQVIANEIEGRLGASTVIGPLNGQLWTFIHLAGTACAAARLMGLGPERTAHAMAISLAQPNLAMWTGFMRFDAKILSAASTSLLGLRAARLAANDLTGPTDILDREDGFYRTFSFLPLRQFLGGLGSTWVTASLALKTSPGCAYIGTAVEALSEIVKDYKEDKGTEITPEEVGSIRVDATLPTMRMEELSRDEGEDLLTPVSVNFSIARSLAVRIIAGRLSADELSQAWLDANRERILDLAARTTVAHDWDMTLDLLEDIDDTVDLGAILSSIPIRDLLSSMRSAGRLHGIGAGSIGEAMRTIRRRGKGRVLMMIKERIAGGADKKAAFFEGIDMGRLKFAFAAEVRLTCRDGREYGASSTAPPGAPGRPGDETRSLLREKFVREASRNIGRRRSEKAIRFVETIPSGEPAETLARHASRDRKPASSRRAEG
ncbi:MmgE/PrpD family protein [Thermodesulfobacteriota bacterium]